MSKFDKLKAVGHNIADSLASGMGLMIGVYMTDVYAEVASAPEGYIDVDFLSGGTSGGLVSQSFANAVKEYQKELPHLCDRHGITAQDFRRLSARFSGQGDLRGFSVTTEDNQGRTSIDQFRGIPGKRVKELDHMGRVRPQRS